MGARDGSHGIDVKVEVVVDELRRLTMIPFIVLMSVACRMPEGQGIGSANARSVELGTWGLGASCVTGCVQLRLSRKLESLR